MAVRLVLLLVAGCAATAEPDDFDDLLARGRTLSLSRENARAYSGTWLEILDRAPSEEIRAEARYNLGCAELRAQRPGIARKWFEEGAESDCVCAARGRSGYQLGQIQFAAGEYEASMRSMAIYLDSVPDNPSWIAAAELRRCECLLRLGRREEAREALQRFIASRAESDRHSAAALERARALLAQLDRAT
ncbi:MAG: tetratricopeptide repeat protein [Planctomycetota bacterium]